MEQAFLLASVLAVMGDALCDDGAGGCDSKATVRRRSSGGAEDEGRGRGRGQSADEASKHQNRVHEVSSGDDDYTTLG